MAIDLTLKSTSITNLDTVPGPVANATGAGAAGMLMEIGDYKTVPASLSITSIIRFCRIPTNAKIKNLIAESQAQGAGKFDIGLYYSTSTKDGTAPSKQGTAVDVDFFATAWDVASLVTPIDLVNESTTYTLAKRNQPIWQAVGLTTDPGGYFDVAATVVTTDVTTGTGIMGLSARFVL